MFYAAAVGGAINEPLFALIQCVQVELLSQTPDQGCRFPGSGGTENQKAAIERETKYFILITVEHRLVAQPHLFDDTAAPTLQKVGGLLFLFQLPL